MTFVSKELTELLLGFPLCNRDFVHLKAGTERYSKKEVLHYDQNPWPVAYSLQFY